VDVLGSFFPAWLLCLVIAVAVTASLQLLLSRLRMSVAYPVLFFVGLATFLTLVLWLIFFP
jgi:multidrug transporter EmrE-like cation transporter